MSAYRSLVCATDTIVGYVVQQLPPIFTLAQYRALEALLFHGPMSQTELSRHTFTGSSSTSLALRILQRQKAVTRQVDPSHRKRHIITITALGKRAVAKILPQQTKLIRALMAVLDRREQQLLARLCYKLAAGDEASLLRELLKTLKGR